MDVCESQQALQKQYTPETRRRPLVPADNKNGTARRVPPREVSSRYKSPTPKRSPSPGVSRISSTSTVSAPKRAISAERKRPSTPSSPPSPSTPAQDTTAETRKIVGNRLREHCPSPSVSRISSTSVVSAPKRAISAERKRPSAPSSPPSPSTPVQDTTEDTRKIVGNRLPERCPSPSASRISSTSTVSAPKRAISAERKRPSTPSSPRYPSTPVQDTTAETRKIVGNRLPESLWPSRMRSLSVSFQSDTFSVPISKKEKPTCHTSSDRTLRPNVAHRQAETASSRKPTPERKRSPLKGKNSADQSENSKPVDSSHSRLVDQHRWPSRTSGKVGSTALNRSVDLTDKMSKISSLSRPSTPSLRRLSLDGAIKPLQKSSSDMLMQMSRDAMVNGCSFDDSSLRMQRPGSSSSSDRVRLMTGASRALSSPNPGSRPSSPSVCRGVSPSRAKAVNPSSRGPSPARGRPSSPSRQQPQSTTTVLSFIADIKKGNKVATHIEDVHQLRMLYNRHLQWVYVNAWTDASLHSQRVKAEKILYSVWMTIADIRDLVMEKRIELQQLGLKLKLYSVLNKQLTCLDEWASIERDHVNSLTQAIDDLQASITRVPVTGGARGDIESVKTAVCSAVDVMQAMGSSLCSILSQAEGMNCLVSELAVVAAHQRAMLDECESLLASTVAMQVEEHSLRTHLLQMKQAWSNRDSSIFGY